MMSQNLKTERICQCSNKLGEGPIWHASSQHLFWFDIDNCELFRADADGTIDGRWKREVPISAAAIVDDRTLLVAGAEGLIEFDFESGFVDTPTPVEPSSLGNRSNDGRVGPHGIFWLGTMSMTNPKETTSGSIYGIKGNEIRVLHVSICIPNSICFSPDGHFAYFTDTLTAKIMKQELDPQTGWPVSPAELFVDTAGLPGLPDGSVIDSEGCLWNARWEGSAVIRFTPGGAVDQMIEVPTPKVTCPAFGGSDLRTMFITTAGGGYSNSEDGAGDIYAVHLPVAGSPERVCRP